MKFATLGEAQNYLVKQGFKPGGDKALGWMTPTGQHAFIHVHTQPSAGVLIRFYVSAERHDFRVTELHEAINAEVERRRQAEAAARAGLGRLSQLEAALQDYQSKFCDGRCAGVPIYLHGVNSDCAGCVAREALGGWL